MGLVTAKETLEMVKLLRKFWGKLRSWNIERKVKKSLNKLSPAEREALFKRLLNG
jgi:hypothetical protein